MLTGLVLTFMGLTWSNSGLFSSVRFMSHLWEKEKEARGERRREGGKKGIEKERKEGRRNKKRLEER